MDEDEMEGDAMVLLPSVNILFVCSCGDTGTFIRDNEVVVCRGCGRVYRLRISVVESE